MQSTVCLQQQQQQQQQQQRGLPLLLMRRHLCRTERSQSGVRCGGFWNLKSAAPRSSSSSSSRSRACSFQTAAIARMRALSKLPKKHLCLQKGTFNPTLLSANPLLPLPPLPPLLPLLPLLLQQLRQARVKSSKQDLQMRKKRHQSQSLSTFVRANLTIDLMALVIFFSASFTLRVCSPSPPFCYSSCSFCSAFNSDWALPYQHRHCRCFGQPPSSSSGVDPGSGNERRCAGSLRCSSATGARQGAAAGGFCLQRGARRAPAFDLAGTAAGVPRTLIQ